MHHVRRLPRDDHHDCKWRVVVLTLTAGYGRGGVSACRIVSPRRSDAVSGEVIGGSSFTIVRRRVSVSGSISAGSSVMRSGGASRARQAILADLTGRKPAGWFSLPRQGDRYAVGAISPKTIDLLLEAGYVYLGNGLADDIPHYWVSDFASRRALLTMPYYYHFDDQFFLMFPRKGMGLGKGSVRSACR